MQATLSLGHSGRLLSQMFVFQTGAVLVYSSMADPDLDLNGDGGGVRFSFACPAGFSSFGDFYLFFLKIRRGAQDAGPLP